MEKVQPYSDMPSAAAVQPRKNKFFVKACIASALIWVILRSWLPHDSVAPDAHDTIDKEDFSWDNLPTKPYLDYVPCYDGFQCSRLELPMDYWNGTTNATISLAVVRRPASVSVLDSAYGGAVLLNPGGPGGSGVGLITRSGKEISETIDSPDGKRFDLISFDPRGVGATLPNVQCVKNAQLDHAWQVRVMEEGLFESSDAAFGRLWSMAIARGQSCSTPLTEAESDIRRFVTTASVARDMLEIVGKHGAWREHEAKRLLQSRTPSCGKSAISEPVELPKSLAYKPGKELIQYWGFSYGTYLGNTFSAMFPGRVGRVVVDGVVDAYNYKQMLWSDNLLDTEKDMDQFYFHCARVGYPACALANETAKTTADGVKQRLANILASLYHDPLPVIAAGRPEVITWSDAYGLIFAGLYSPIQSFPFMANLLAQVEKGDGTEFAKLLESYHDFSCPGRGAQGFSIIPLRNATKGTVGMSYDATLAISCSDGDDQSWMNKTEFRAYAKDLARMSPSIGSQWSTIRMTCIHYSGRPEYRFEGPWIANTSHPLLLIGNTADPVTPAVHARNMAKGFKGAVALTQDSAGHCSSSTYSNCTRSYIRQYFQTGELPPINTTCAADELPFGPSPNETTVASIELQQARQSHAQIGAALLESGGGFMRLGQGGRVANNWFP